MERRPDRQPVVTRTYSGEQSMPQTLDTSSNFLALPSESSAYNSSGIVVIPVPYEHTVSYGVGAKDGPRAILSASRYIEFYDEELDRELCFDTGIATVRPLSFGGKQKKVDESAVSYIEQKVSAVLDDDKFAAVIGGEHTITAGSAAAHVKKYPELSILQFDAHSDFREAYEGNRYSHASVMARVAEFIDPAKIVQIGIRAQAREEAVYAKENNVNTFYAYEIRQGRYNRLLKNWEDQVIEKLGDMVYITFDVDYFDPSVMPATGTPEPNGMFWSETMTLLGKLGQRKRIIGFDVVELAPMKGLHHPDASVAKLVYKIMNYAFQKQRTE
jgi:agmatinase